MGFRFRKSVRLGKGLRLNFSGSGVSATIGGRGSSVSVGKRGVYQNFSIPGTGLSYRTKIAGGSHASRGAASQTAPRIPAAVRQWQEYTGEADPSASFSVDERGEIVFHDATGAAISDPHLIAIIMKTPGFREQKARLQQERQHIGAQTVEQDRARMRSMLNVCENAPAIEPKEAFERRLEELEPETYRIRDFDEPAPSAEQLRLEVSREADAAVNTIAFWKTRRLKNEYFAAHIDRRYRESMAAWNRRKSAFEADEVRKKAEEDLRLHDEYLAERHALECALSGDPTYVEDAVERWFDACDLPVSIDVHFEYRSDARVLLVDLDLPEIEDLPREKLVQLKSGVVKAKSKPLKELRAEYARCVFGVCAYVAASLFAISPAIESLTLSAYTQRPDKNGDIVDDYIVSMRLPRAGLCGVDLKTTDPKRVCLGFEARCKLTQTDLFRSIAPFEA